MATLQQLADRFGYAELGAAFGEIDIPVLTGMQRQGDILILPRDAALLDERKFYAIEGLPLFDLVSDDQHSHTLHGAGWVHFFDDPDQAPAPNSVAWLIVPNGAEAYLMHSAEHGALGIGPGHYEIRSQMEYFGVYQWVSVVD